MDMIVGEVIMNTNILNEPFSVVEIETHRDKGSIERQIRAQVDHKFKMEIEKLRVKASRSRCEDILKYNLAILNEKRIKEKLLNDFLRIFEYLGEKEPIQA